MDPRPAVRAARARARARRPLRSIHLVFIAAALLGLAGCEYSVPPPEAPDEPPPTQAAYGAQLYAANCACCHGENGEGLEERPPFLGEKSLPIDPPAEAQVRKSRLRTAQDLFDFIKSDMPPLSPGMLSDEQTWAVVAFRLKASGAYLGDGAVNATNAASIALHP